MTVQIIKATRTAPGIKSQVRSASRKVRVAAYCRVSTDSEEQETSYITQCSHYRDFIRTHEGWELAGIYADEGISGTQTKNRKQFNKMIKDCENGRIDMVITKSISRWARNTIDSLKNIRKLKELGIPVLFEKENINTLDAKGEVLITIMSSIAQQESDSISKNVRLGIQYRMQQGKGRFNTSRFLGYDKGEDGKLVIIPEQAVLVRRIYREYLEGYSPGWIAAHLTKDGIVTPAGNAIWYASTISSILENEKYCGDLLLQKYFVEDFLTHRIVKNEGQLPQYYVENDHDPIVPKEIYRQVQGEMLRRSSLKADPEKFRIGSSQALSGRLICGKCGRTLKKYTAPDKQSCEWRCRKRAYERKSFDKEMPPKCTCRHVREKEVQQAILEAFYHLQRAAVQKELKQKMRSLAEEKTRCEGRLQMHAGVADGGRQDTDTMQLKIAAIHHQQMQIRILQELIELMKANKKQGSASIAELPPNTEISVSPTNILYEPDPPMTQHDAVSPILASMEQQNAVSPQSVPVIMRRRTFVAEQPACHGSEDFFRRTRYLPPEPIFDSRGKMIIFADETIIRYLENVVVQDEEYLVRFKAGITIDIPVNS